MATISQPLTGATTRKFPHRTGCGRLDGEQQALWSRFRLAMVYRCNQSCSGTGFYAGDQYSGCDAYPARVWNGSSGSVPSGMRWNAAATSGMNGNHNLSPLWW